MHIKVSWVKKHSLVRCPVPGSFLKFILPVALYLTTSEHMKNIRIFYSDGFPTSVTSLLST